MQAHSLLRSCFASRQRLAAGTVALIAAGAVGMTLAVAPATAATARHVPTQANELATASELARSSGQRVEVPSARSQTSQTFANPNGTFTSEVYALPVANHAAMADVSGLSSYDWTQINKANPSQSYWNYDRTDAKVGYSNWSSPAVTYRSFFLFSFSGWQGRTVTTAKFQITLDHSASCSPTPVDLYRTANISRSAPVTWNNSSGPATWQVKLSAASGSANETTCAQPDLVMGFGNVASSVQTAVDGGAQLTLGLRAPNEADPFQWKRFHPTTARLLVDWTVA